MQESKTREKVLKKIRNSILHQTNNPFPQVDIDGNIYLTSDQSDEVVFARQLLLSGGNFIFCEDKFEFAEQLLGLAEQKKWEAFVCPDEKICSFLQACEISNIPITTDFSNTEVVITACECLISRTGSVVISSKQAHGRRIPIIANNHIVVATTNQLVGEIKDAMTFLKNKYNGRLPSMFTIITGPSKTADIELTQVTGAHGPENIFVFLVEHLELGD